MRAHLYRKITDSQGNVVPNTVVSIYEAGTTQLLLQTLYVLEVGSEEVANPLTTSDGFVSFWIDKPQSVRIGLKLQGTAETYIDDVPVSVSPQNLVQADVAFEIVNAPTDGFFLQHGQPGVATWVDAGDLVNSKPSPLNQIYAYDFSGSDSEDLVITNADGTVATPAFEDVTADTKPADWTFTGALRAPAGGAITTPAQTWVETGSVIFLYKIVSANQGVGAAKFRVVIDNGALLTETPVVADLMNEWLVGYLDDVPAGSHRVGISHIAGTDAASYVLLGPLWLQAGNNIPEHYHPGVGTNSVRLGEASTADFTGSTAVGGTAQALGDSATVLGASARAGSGSLALGASTIAGTDAVVIGHQATTPTGKAFGVVVGKAASAADDGGVAIGASASAVGLSSVAVGSGAKTGAAADSVALGAGAQALAERSVALGRNAVVAAGHTGSMAIGPGVVTTAANQARIGDSETTVVIPGNFRQVGGDALFAGAGDKLGFFGSAGVTRPTILGSRGGNATLGTLLTALHNMGLITNQTTS